MKEAQATANLVREMSIAATRLEKSQGHRGWEEHWTKQMDYLERQLVRALSGEHESSNPAELSTEEILKLVDEWESTAARAATVGFRDFGAPHAADFEVRMPGDVLAMLLRKLRAALELQSNSIELAAQLDREAFQHPFPRIANLMRRAAGALKGQTALSDELRSAKVVEKD